MRITIEYESSWRNSFLDGSNDEPLIKKGRGFVGSMTALKKEGNFKYREITHSTVMGVLNRLIGDQRKLYQARQKINADSYFFENIEEHVTFLDKPTYVSNEMVYLRNMKGSTDQNSFSGILKTSDAMFSSDYSSIFWGILELDFDELCHFIIGKESSNTLDTLDPLYICASFEQLGKLKPILNEGLANTAIDKLAEIFPTESYLNNKGLVIPSMLYCSAMYIQLERLEKTFDMASAKTKAGGISGISKRSFTKKDFMKRFTTGNGKTIWGNPYMKKDRIKGEGEVTSMLTKASGKLDIIIDVNKKDALEIAELIDNAGVSSFYLGKKGLAFVKSINTAEVSS